MHALKIFSLSLCLTIFLMSFKEPKFFGFVFSKTFIFVLELSHLTTLLVIVLGGQQRDTAVLRSFFFLFNLFLFKKWS